MAHSISLSEARRGNTAIVATELATNLLRHARRGRVWLQTLHLGGLHCMELLAVDAGPGIVDLQRCMLDGYSSGGTAGTGLGAVRRLADEFDAYSTPGKGTVVLARIHAGHTAAETPFTLGAVSLAAPGEFVCGDAWHVAQRDHAIAVVVADGLGHGPLAGEAALKAIDVFGADPFADADQFFRHAHGALVGSRGAAVARALVNARGEVEYAGVGNIAGSLVGVETSRGLPSQNGTVGVEMRSHLTTSTYAWPDRGVLLMHSDGITQRWSLEAYPGLLMRHPAVLAAVLCRDFIRGRDDATVLVVKRAAKRGPA
jgi:anti-sigma regulatory factor (Ser/Thr protein kinase)